MLCRPTLFITFIVWLHALQCDWCWTTLWPEQFVPSNLSQGSVWAIFYLLTKIHKPGNPGSPIVASNSALTENISCFTDFFLWPSVTQLSSYIRDTTDFINKLRRLPRLPPSCLLVTLNVSLLYMNIPHEEGINSLWGIFKSLRDTGPSSGWPLPAHLVNTIEELIRFNKSIIYRSMVLPWENVHLYGTIICWFVHGKAQMEVAADPVQNASGSDGSI